jgi:hypothetical protein
VAGRAGKKGKQMGLGRESPVITVWDGSRIVDMFIHTRTAAHPQPDECDKELVRIFKEYQRLKEVEKKYQKK